MFKPTTKSPNLRLTFFNYEIFRNKYMSSFIILQNLLRKLS